MADGFKSSSDKLPETQLQAARKTGVDALEGSSDSIVTPNGDGTGGGAKKVTARRDSAFGGSAGSSMQAAIGGPFGGRSGNVASKTARIAGLPA